MDTPERKTPLLLIAAAWTIVSLPLAWGVYESAVKSVPLFQLSAPAAPGPAPK